MYNVCTLGDTKVVRLDWKNNVKLEYLQASFAFPVTHLPSVGVMQ